MLERMGGQCQPRNRQRSGGLRDNPIESEEQRVENSRCVYSRWSKSHGIRHMDPG